MTRNLLFVGLVCAWCLGLAPKANAQVPTTATPTSVTITAIAAVGDPVTVPAIGNPVTTAISAGSVNCNLPVTSPAAVAPTNPTVFAFDDPFTANRECRVPGPVGLPNGSFRAVSNFNATCGTATCSSPRSVVAAPGVFPIQGPVTAPSAPQDLHLP